MEKIRSFIAIELNKELKEELASLTEKLSGSGADVKWVRCENIHFTLKFLGHISAERIENVKKVLDSVGKEFKPFRISLSGIGAFPNPSYPRVIWVGIAEGADCAKEVFEFLEAGLEGEGFEKEERPFSPHLTIGRVRSPKNRQNLKSSIEGLSFSSGKILDVNHITLFQSTLTPKGPIYTPLYEVHLSG